MAQSVELLLDETADAYVREQWAALRDAGLPSMARIPAESNRPHVTLWAGRSLDAATESGLPARAPTFPLPFRLGALACFGHRRLVLVRLVVTSICLLRFQATIAEHCGVEADSHVGPGRWTPHVTLAHRLSAAQVGTAMDVLGRRHDQSASAVAWRRWDGTERREWLLPAG